MEKARYKILMIEDDKLDQKAFMHMVEEKELAYDCTIAGSVSEALSILDSESFDIVIADYSLPDGTAFDVLVSVRNIPIIFVTGAGDEEVAVSAHKAGAYDYLIKDIERKYLKIVPVTIDNAIKYKRTEEKLQLLSGAIMSTDDSIYITDMEDKIIYVNIAFCKTYGYSQEDIIGKDSNVLWEEKTRSKEPRKIFRTFRGIWEVGSYHKRKDGSKFPVSHSRSSIRDKNGNYAGVIGISRNITDRIILEDKIRTINLKMKEKEKSTT